MRANCSREAVPSTEIPNCLAYSMRQENYMVGKMKADNSQETELRGGEDAIYSHENPMYLESLESNAKMRRRVCQSHWRLFL